MIRALRSHGSPGGHVESLYRDHAAEVYRYALAMLGSPADAEDATQATFLNAFRALERGDHPRQPGAWLRTIVHNLCLQQFRLVSRRPNQVELDDEADRLFADDGAPELEDVIRAMKLVPFNQRAALVMREFEGRPLSEIGETLGVSTAAVETLLFRARRSLRELLEESLTCAETELAISRQLDGVLPRGERGRLRAHLRQCEECSRIARRMRAQRASMQSLAVLPVPAALAWWGAGGHAGGALAGAGAGTAAGAGAAGSALPLGASVLTKIAATALASSAIGGLGYVGVRQHVIDVPFAPSGQAPQVHRAASAPTGVLSGIMRVQRDHSVRPFPVPASLPRSLVHALVLVRPPFSQTGFSVLDPLPARPLDAVDPIAPVGPRDPEGPVAEAPAAGAPDGDGSSGQPPAAVPASPPSSQGGGGEGHGPGQGPSSQPPAGGGSAAPGDGPSNPGGQGNGNAGDGHGNPNPGGSGNPTTGDGRGNPNPGTPRGSGNAGNSNGNSAGAHGNAADAEAPGNSAIAHAANNPANPQGAGRSANAPGHDPAGGSGGAVAPAGPGTGAQTGNGAASGNAASAPGHDPASGAPGNSGGTPGPAATATTTPPGNSGVAHPNSGGGADSATASEAKH